MITLYQFGPGFGLADPSPFCLKVDLYLRAAGLPYQTRAGFQHLRSAPLGKLPYIEDNGTVVPDSTFIISYLKAEYGDPLDRGLGAEQKAVTHAFGKMLDENLYWCIVFSRWFDEDCWPEVRKSFFGGMPVPLRWIVPRIARRSAERSLHGHGIGRHDKDRIMEIARRDMAALSAYLGEREYFLGETLSTLDVYAFAFLAELIVPPLDCEARRIACSFDNLVRFVDRIRSRYY